MKKFIALFLILSLVVVNCATIKLSDKSGKVKASPERRGADLVIQKKDEGKVEGELITVKGNVLLLKLSYSS